MQIILTVVLWVMTGFLVVAALLPLSKIAFGAIRGLAFPREQFLCIALVLAALMPVVHPGVAGYAGAAVLLATVLIQLVYVVKFTPFWRKQSFDAASGLRADTDRHLTLLAANVKKSNREYDRLIAMIHARRPDLAMAIEVDAAWIEALEQGLSDIYPHWVNVPEDNGYGLSLMSRLPLSDTDVRELITDGVPSIRTAVTLPSGERIRLYVVHPEPPTLTHDTRGRDSEIALIGIEAGKDQLPAVVTGDLNDVAWSTTTRRFQRLSGLLDPRVGRGFFNTFSATMPWMRWPLDHLFHDPQFRLMEMERLGKIGSDHFPMWFALALAETEAIDSAPADAPADADAEERREVGEMIRQERARDRDAIGSDWEDE